MTYYFYQQFGSQYLRIGSYLFIWSSTFQVWLGTNGESYLGFWITDDFGSLVPIVLRTLCVVPTQTRYD